MLNTDVLGKDKEDCNCSLSLKHPHSPAASEFSDAPTELKV